MNQMNTNTDAHAPEWVSKFPLLKDVTDDAWLETANRAKEVTLPANYEVFHDGDPCENYIFVVDGATRVYKSFENGREMLLYRLQAGIDIDEDGRVYMIDQYFRKLDIFRPVEIGENEGFVGAWAK